MEKLLTITIPVYNTEEYLPRCIQSLIVPDFLDKIEILIVIDGSPDNSIEVARKYELQYPNTIKVVDKPNGGHGSTINKGIELATGKYFRVLDSDDWFDTEEFKSYLKKLMNTNVDMILTPSTKEYTYKNKSEKLEFENLQYNIMYDTSVCDFSHFIGDKFNTMARTTYKTKILREARLKLPEHTFYVDVLYSLCVIPYVRDFIVFNNNIYRYFIGRPEQSINNYSRHLKDLKTVICLCIDFLYQYNAPVSEKMTAYLTNEVRNRVKNYSLLCYTNLTPKEVVNDWNIIKQHIALLPAKDKKYFTKELRNFQRYKISPSLFIFILKFQWKMKRIFKI